MATLTLSTITGTVLVNSSTVAGSLTLPTIANQPGRGLLILPSAYASTITLLTQPTDAFQTKEIRQLSDSNDIAHLVGGPDSKWYELQGGLFPNLASASSISTQLIIADSTITSHLSTPLQTQVQLQTLNNAFTPLQIPGLIQWLDGADPISMTTDFVSTPTDTQVISFWKDKSPVGNDVFTFINPLVYTSNARNGKSVLFTDGARAMKTYKQIPFPTTEFTFFLVFTPSAGTDNWACVEGIPDFTFYAGIDSSDLAVIAGGDTTMWNTSSFSVIPNVTIYNTWPILECQASNGFFRPFLNGNPKQATQFTISSFNEWAIGGYTNQGTGYIGEVILFSTAISETDRQRVEGYLSQKWAPIPIPTTNPNLSTVASAPLSLPAFSPSSISSLFFWASAEDLQALPDGAPVYCWSNRMDLSFSASTLTAPFYSKSDQALYFDREFRELRINKDRLPTGSNAYQFVAVARATSNDSSGIFGYGNYGTTNQANALRYNNLNGIRHYWWDTDLDLTISPSFESPSIVTAGTTLNLTQSENRRVVSVNGFSFLSDSPGGVHNVVSACNATIGNGYYDYSISRASLFNGFIHELFLFSNAISESDLEKLEGYLAEKYKIQYKLPRVHPSYVPLSTVSQALNFSPSSISSLTLWLDGLDPLNSPTKPEDNARVATWFDKSGRSNNAQGPAQYSAPMWGRAPRYNASLSSLRFYSDSNASRNYIETTWYTLPNNTLPTLNSAFTIFAVADYSADKQVVEANTILASGNVYSAGNKLILITGFPGGSYHGYTDDGSTTVYFGTPKPNSNTLYEFSFGGNTVDAMTTLYMNGSVMTRTPNPSWASLQSYSNYIGRFGNFVGINNQMDGNIYEILVYKSLLTQEDREKVEGYLTHKWNLQLPAGHPYRATAPTNAEPPPPSTFYPANYPGLKVWLDASDSNSLILSGSTITTWMDKSPNSTIFYTPDVTTDPNSTIQLSTSVLFGKSMAAFNTNTFLYTSSLVSTNIIPYSYFMVTKQLGSGTSNAVLSFSHNGCNDSYTTAYTFESETQRQYQNNGLNMATAINPMGIYTGILRTRQNQEYGWGFYRVNGSWSNGLGTTAPNDFNVPFSTLSLGARLLNNTIVTGPDFGGNSYLGEFLLFGQDLPIDVAQRVEGYLAWKWGLEKQLPSIHPWRNTSPSILPRPLFTPLQLGKPGVWLDASDVTTLFIDAAGTTQATNNQSIECWKSRSNAGLSTVQTVAEKRPTYLTNAFSNKPGLNFLEFQHLFANSAATGLQATASTFTMYAVASYPTLAGNAAIPVSQWHDTTGGVNPPLRYELFFNGSGSIYLLYNTDQIVNAGVAPPTANTLNFLGLTGAFPLDTGSISVNGSNIPINSINYIQQGANDFCVGHPAATGFFGTIHEVVGYPFALSTPDRLRLEGYLAWKWGFQSRLPASHPWKSQAP